MAIRQWLLLPHLLSMVLATVNLPPPYQDNGLGSHFLVAQSIFLKILPGQQQFAPNQSSIDAILPRQSGGCPSGSKLCGNACIPPEDSCCTGLSTNCPPGYYCDQGGCCPNGETCTEFTNNCPQSEKICGQFCIPTEATCCPDQQGGCLPGLYCSLGDDGIYGCCPNGETCAGGAGGGGGVPSLSTNNSPSSTSVVPSVVTSVSSEPPTTVTTSQPPPTTTSPRPRTTTSSSIEAILTTPITTTTTSTRSTTSTRRTPSTTSSAATTSPLPPSNDGTQMSVIFIRHYALLQIVIFLLLQW